MERVKTVIQIPNLSIHAWTDSAIALAWISTPSYKLKTFVSNRVASIQGKIEPQHWHYVKTTLNPADYATRCQFSSAVISLMPWWEGPAFLLDTPELRPKTPDHFLPPKKIPELKEKVLTQNTITENTLLTRYSSLTQLLRVTACILRWKKGYEHFRKGRTLQPLEIQNAKDTWVRKVQQDHYAAEIGCLKTKKTLPARSSLLSLNPMIDDKGIMRVRGRLRNAQLSTAM